MGRFGLFAYLVECLSEPAFIDGGLKMAGTEEVEPVDFSFHGLGCLKWRFIVSGLLWRYPLLWLLLLLVHMHHLLEVIEAHVVEVSALVLAGVVSEADDHLVALVQVILLDAVVHDGEQHAVGVTVGRLLKILENEVLLRPFTPLACA